MKKGLIIVLGLVLVIVMSAGVSSEHQYIGDCVIVKNVTIEDNCIYFSNSETSNFNKISINDFEICFNLPNELSDTTISGWKPFSVDSYAGSGFDLTIDGIGYSQQSTMIFRTRYDGGGIEQILKNSWTNFYTTFQGWASGYPTYVGEMSIGLDNNSPSFSPAYVCLDGVIILEDKYIKQRISALESWQQTIDLTIQAIEPQLETVKQWLFFWDYQGAEENVCDAIENECSGTIPCTDECNAEDIGCADENTRWNCVMQNDGCYDKIEINCVDYEVCENGECTDQLQEVIFRTNAVNGDYKSGTWIAVDTNNNCGLEGYDYSGSSGILSSCKGTLLVNNPEGYGVYLYSGKVYVCVSLGTKFVYKKYYSSSTTAVTSSSQTEPYASNNQEVYGECTPS